MAEKDKRFYWLKLKSEFMNGEIVDFLMSQKNGANYVVLYQMLALKTMNTNGKLCCEIGEVIIPFDPEKIQRECKWFDIDTIRVAIELYSKLGLVYKNKDGILQITRFEELVGSETYWAKQKRIQKEKDKFIYIKKISNEQFMLPNGERRYIDEKRYGGNGMAVWDRSMGKCEICGSEENLCIHHNNGYSNELEDLVVVCRSCHRDIESGNKKWEGVGKPLENFQHSLISNNLISNNNINNNIYKEIIDYLNEKAKTKYRQVENNYKHIRARINEGFSLEDFKLVIDKKCKEWIGTEFEKYLTQETLFRPSNFEKYLNQNIVNKQDPRAAKQREYTKEELDSSWTPLDEIEI